MNLLSETAEFHGLRSSAVTLAIAAVEEAPQHAPDAPHESWHEKAVQLFKEWYHSPVGQQVEHFVVNLLISYAFMKVKNKYQQSAQMIDALTASPFSPAPPEVPRPQAPTGQRLVEKVNALPPSK